MIGILRSLVVDSGVVRGETEGAAVHGGATVSVISTGACPEVVTETEFFSGFDDACGAACERTEDGVAVALRCLGAGAE